MGFPDGSVEKNLPANAGDVGSIPGLGRSSREGNDSPLQYSCLEKSYGRRSLVGSSLWGQKESDTTEWLTVSVTGSYSLVSTVNVKEREEEFSAPPFLIYS